MRAPAWSRTIHLPPFGAERWTWVSGVCVQPRASDPSARRRRTEEARRYIEEDLSGPTTKRSFGTRNSHAPRQEPRENLMNARVFAAVSRLGKQTRAPA